MNNYEYILASLPVLQVDSKERIDVAGLLEGIREHLDRKDREALDFLLSGFEADNLNAGFYLKASRHGVRFIRSFFDFDRRLRNTKTAYLNRCLGRPEGTDVLLLLEDEDLDFEERPEAESVLEGSDILTRERGLDELLWNKIDGITVMDVFDIDAILGFVAKLQIIARWLRLDEQSGRELFRRLINEIKDNYTI